MSVWGPGPFENDDAADWLSEVEEEPSLEVIDDAVSEVADPANVGYVEIPDGAVAVAAAELLAQLLGKPGATSIAEGEAFDEDAFSSLAEEAGRLGPGAKERVVRRAYTAVDRVLNDQENSELRQVLQEDKSGMSAWTNVMQDLLNRLQAIAASLKPGGPDERRR